MTQSEGSAKRRPWSGKAMGVISSVFITARQPSAMHNRKDFVT